MRRVTFRALSSFVPTVMMLINSPKRGGCEGRMQHVTGHIVETVDDQNSLAEPAFGATTHLFFD